MIAIERASSRPKRSIDFIKCLRSGNQSSEKLILFQSHRDSSRRDHTSERTPREALERPERRARRTRAAFFMIFGIAFEILDYYFRGLIFSSESKEAGRNEPPGLPPETSRDWNRSNLWIERRRRLRSMRSCIEQYITEKSERDYSLFACSRGPPLARTLSAQKKLGGAVTPPSRIIPIHLSREAHQ